MLIILKFIEKISGNIHYWSKFKIETYQPIEKWITDLVKNVLCGLVLFCMFFMATLLVCYPKNIQDKKIEEPVKKIETRTPDKKEYKRLKKHFVWLKEEVYYFIKIEAEKKKVDPMYVLAVIDYESAKARGNNWDKMKIAVSRAGARGVMQVMPFHASNPADLFKWKYNIKKGIWYLKGALEIAGGDIRKAARLYNQGWYGNPRKYRNWKYVARIANKYKKVLTDKVMVASNE